MPTRLDDEPPSAYNPASMNRAFLALLALLTGLVAQVAPVQARIVGVGETEINSVAGARAGQHQTTTRPAAARPQVVRQDRQREQSRPAVRRVPVYIPSVLLGVDRTLE